MSERTRFCAVLAACGLIVGVGAASALPTGSAARRGLHVVGNRLVDAKGRTVHFRGVNRSGTEYACIQGWGIFDGPSNESAVNAMAAWRVNAVRIPLNEDCWLGINGVKSQYAGANYRRAIVNYVKRLHRHNMYAELSLIWAAPGTYRATYQPNAPDKDHSPAFWSSLARTFKKDPNVLLAPWGETTVDPDCFLRGGICSATYGPNNERYVTAGMQQAVTVMRRAGYRGPIVIPGVDYANDMTKWLSHKPKDPLRQLVAEAHVYGKNTCSSPECLNRTMLPVARRVPLIFGETGPSYDDSDCGSGTISRLLHWADAHNVGYEAWAWNTWKTCNSIISDFGGTPRGEYGSWLKSYLASNAKTTHGPRR